MIDIIKACTDLGTHVCGAELGPDVLMNEISHPSIQNIYKITKIKGEKELEPSNKRKNIDRINLFNEELFRMIKNSLLQGNFPITLGGDHSLAIGSALASISENKNLGIIWIDAHADYNTFETTITGNIHGLPFATITGQVPEGLTSFFDGDYYLPQNAVLVGARSIDMPKEMENLKKAGVHVYLDKDVKALGIETVMQEAFEIASNGTNGVHISLDVDVMNPVDAPGVSIPEADGFSKMDFSKVVDSVIFHKDVIKSLDFVEFNPLNDKDNRTYDFVKNELKKLIENF